MLLAVGIIEGSAVRLRGEGAASLIWLEEIARTGGIFGIATASEVGHAAVVVFSAVRGFILEAGSRISAVQLFIHIRFFSLRFISIP